MVSNAQQQAPTCRVCSYLIKAVAAGMRSICISCALAFTAVRRLAAPLLPLLLALQGRSWERRVLEEASGSSAQSTNGMQLQAYCTHVQQQACKSLSIVCNLGSVTVQESMLGHEED